MQHKRSFLSLSILVALLIGSTFLLEYCRPSGTPDAGPDNEGEKAGFVGDKTCQSCHAKEYALWQTSDHFKAMMPANDSTVLGDFNNASFTADGVTSHFFRKEGRYFINTEGPDGRNHDYEVLHTFGYKPLQQYLVAFPGGRMQVPRVSWDVNARKWFHQYAGQKIDHRDWLHWSNGGQNWNTMCASCHSTNLQKNYLPASDSFHTTWSVMTVSCESCHGPASKHVSFAQSGGYKDGMKGKDSYLRPSDSVNTTQVNTCAPCHARKTDIGQHALNTAELMDDLIPEIPTTEHFHADGQVNDEDYIYTSFVQSKMFHRNVKCSNCHDPHSGKRLLAGNLLCLQCHQKKYDSFEHQQHDMASGQVTCVSCHMPGKLYMGNDLRHDHSFRVPRPDLSVKYGTPNACNDCHKDKKAQWASDAVVKWFGPTRKPHFSEDLIAGSLLNAQSEQHLSKLYSDTAIPAIVKAAAANYLRDLPTRNSLNTLLGALRDADPQVRYRALHALGSFPASEWQDGAGPLLQDKVRAVRIAAADAFLSVRPDAIPIAYRESFTAAKQELVAYLNDQLDFPVGNVMLADHYYRQNDFFNAEKYYQRGLRMDSLMNYARFNLSSLYNAQGKNAEALKVLQDAERTDPKSDRVQYNLALLHSEMKDMKSAATSFGKAVALGSNDPRLYYNYGIFQQQAGKPAEAEKLFQKGLTFGPNDPDINYALAYLYVQMKQPAKAMGPASVLKRIDPGNQQYQALFRQLQLN
jgi:tetratricopeptide (TPR) repeat protein